MRLSLTHLLQGAVCCSVCEAIMLLACTFFNDKTIFGEAFNVKLAANDHKCSIVSKRSSQFGCVCSSTRPLYWAIAAHGIAIDLSLKWRAGFGARLEYLFSLQCTNTQSQNPGTLVRF